VTVTLNMLHLMFAKTLEEHHIWCSTRPKASLNLSSGREKKCFISI